MNIKYFTVFAFFLVVFLNLSLAGFALAQDIGGEIVNVFPPCQGELGIDCVDYSAEETKKDIRYFIIRIYQFAIGAAGILAVGVIVAGAIRRSVSGGNASQVEEGNSMITSAIWGIVLLFGSYIILNTINPALVSLKNPGEDEPAINAECTEYENEVDAGSVTFATSTMRKIKNDTKYCVLKQLANNDCGDFASINIEDSRGNSDVGGGITTCGIRKVVTGRVLDIRDDDIYYDEDVSETINSNSVVWLYPYYPPNENGSIQSDPGPRCLIYAYKEKRDSASSNKDDLDEVKMIDLEDNLRLCAPKQQESQGFTQCLSWGYYLEKWEFRGGQNGDWFRADDFEILTKPVSSQDFPYSDPKINPSDTPEYTRPADHTTIQYRGDPFWRCTNTRTISQSRRVPDQTCSPNEAVSSNSFETHEEAVAALGGIEVRSTGSCINRCIGTCTSLKGLPKTVIEKVKQIKNECSGCEIIITGGTEIGHQTHGLDKPIIDLHSSEGLGLYLKNNATSLGIKRVCTTENFKSYRINCPNFTESKEHFHVEF